MTPWQEFAFANPVTDPRYVLDQRYLTSVRSGDRMFKVLLAIDR